MPTASTAAGPVRQEMKCVRPLADPSRGYVYRAERVATRPSSDYTARVIPQRSGVAFPLENRESCGSDETGQIAHPDDERRLVEHRFAVYKAGDTRRRTRWRDGPHRIEPPPPPPPPPPPLPHKLSVDAKHARLISRRQGQVAVRVIRTDEEQIIARSVFGLLKLDDRNSCHEHQHTIAGTPPQDGRLLAGRELSFGRADLSVRQSAAQTAADARRRQAHAARTLGHHARAEFHLRASESRHQEIRSRHDLCLRPRPRRAGGGRQHLSRRHL